MSRRAKRLVDLPLFAFQHRIEIESDPYYQAWRRAQQEWETIIRYGSLAGIYVIDGYAVCLDGIGEGPRKAEAIWLSRR